jgi:predicted amidohydrolase YtcJ
MRHTVFGGAIALAVIGAAFGLTGRAEDTPPDLIIHHGKIVTVDSVFSIAQAAAIRGGKFIAVGTDDKVLALAGPGTQKVDLRGRTVLPGFNDTHNHQNSGITLVTNVDLTNIHSIDDIQTALHDRLKTAKKGEVIAGTRGWWEYELADKRLPTRYDLDKVAPDNPVAIPGPHYTIVNSLALKMAGITRDTKDPQGGEIWKDPKTGEPTGLLMDNAGSLVRALFTPPTHDQEIAGLRKIMAIQNGFGLTSLRQPGGSAADVALYRELYDHGQLTTRVDFAYNVDAAAPEPEFERQLTALGAPGQQFGDGMFRADGIAETGLDGAELTAFLRDDLPIKPGYRGLQKIPTEHFKKFAAAANRHGWRLGPHAVGDAAIDEALDAFEYANAEKSIVGRRWMIDHAFLLRPDHYDRVKKLGLIINSQYMHNYQLGELILRAWKRPLADMSERYKDWVANGIMLAGGSDGPVSYHAEPLLEIYGEITRKTGWGGSLGPDQGLTREQAIRSVTSNSAYTSFEEKAKGSIEPGKYADFVVLTKDILTIPADAIKDTHVIATVLGGKTVYGTLAPSAPSSQP